MRTPPYWPVTAEVSATPAIVHAVSLEAWVGLTNIQAVYLVKAIIGQESMFDPRAYRAEPAIGDASRGLMQVLLRTARGLGYTGAAGNDTTRTGGLYDPVINVGLGVKLLAQNLRTARGDWNTAISGYNQGIGRAVEDRAARRPYRNQAYVEQVLANYAYFSRGAMPPPSTTPAPVTLPTRGKGCLVLLPFLGAVVWLGLYL